MPDDQLEQEFKSIVIPLLAPQIVRLLNYCVAALGTVGVTIIPSQDSGYKIASGIASGLFVLGSELWLRAHAKSNAQSAFSQGASAVGATLMPHEIPPVVSGTLPTPDVIPPQGLLAGPTASASLNPVSDGYGNITISPKGNPEAHKGTPENSFPPTNPSPKDS